MVVALSNINTLHRKYRETPRCFLTYSDLCPGNVSNISLEYISNTFTANTSTPGVVNYEVDSSNFALSLKTKHTHLWSDFPYADTHLSIPASNDYASGATPITLGQHFKTGKAASLAYHHRGCIHLHQTKAWTPAVFKRGF